MRNNMRSNAYFVQNYFGHAELGASGAIARSTIGALSGELRSRLARDRSHHPRSVGRRLRGLEVAERAR